MGGISLEAFRNSYKALEAAALTNTRLEVNNEKKTSVKTAEGEDNALLKLDQLEKLPNGQARIADNIYMRGQLLTAIRASLISMNVTGRTDCLDNEAAKAFFKQAETRLFGGLQTNKKTGGKEFGEETASSDLNVQTVKDLVEALDRLTNKQKTGFAAIKAVCPNATDAQIKAVTMITDRELVKMFGLTSDEAVKATFSGFKLDSNERFGNRLTFTVTVPGRAPLAAHVDARGVLGGSIEDHDFLVKSGDACSHHMGVVLAKQIPPRDHKQVAKLLDIASKGNMTTDEKYGENAHDYADLLHMVLVGMLPAAYAQARQLQPSGDITLETWWKALDLGGKVPKEQDAKEKIGQALVNALLKRTMTDFAKVNGLKQKDIECLRWEDAPEGVRELTDKEKAIRRQYTSFLMVSDFSYQARVNFLKNPKYKFTPVETRQIVLRSNIITRYGTDIPSMISQLESASRQYGTKYSFGKKLEFVQKKGASAKDFIETLNKTYKFSPEQLALLVYSNNDYEFALQDLLGGTRSQRKLDIKIEATGDPEKPDMRVTYNIPFLKGTENELIVTKQNIVHTVVYTQDGDSWGEELKLVDVRAKNMKTTLYDWGKV